MAPIHFLRRRIIYVCACLILLFFIISKNSSTSHNTLSDDIINEITHLKETKLEDITTSLVSAVTPEEEETILDPCTIINPLTNQFFDLRPLSSLNNNNEIQAWNAKGFDYGRNFSIGICSTPLRQINALTNLDFVDSQNKSDIAGYYTNSKGHKVSIGSVSSTDLKFRGMNLIMEYSNGDKCENTPDLSKSTLLTFKCDREMMSKARVNYLGSSNNCSYFFEVRTVHACATSYDEDDGDIWIIFLTILLSAVGVYFFAGIMYKIIKNHYEKRVKMENVLV